MGDRLWSPKGIQLHTESRENSPKNYSGHKHIYTTGKYCCKLLGNKLSPRINIWVYVNSLVSLVIEFFFGNGFGEKKGGGVNGIPEIIYYLRLLICIVITV